MFGLIFQPEWCEIMGEKWDWDSLNASDKENTKILMIALDNEIVA